MMKIAVLLSTYNSSIYLSDLLQSVRDQTYEGWQMFIRDDLSEDGTLEVIRRYVRGDGRIRFLEDGVKRGAMNGFMWLLQQVEADYYMFCDHDDVWKKNKIEVTLNEMLKAERGGMRPLVVHTDLEVVDAHLVMRETSFWESQSIKEKEFNDKYYHLVYNNVTGCTMMINRLARKVSLPVHPNAQMHDSWVVAAVLWHGGRVYSVHGQTILYRQHGKNTIGVNELPSIVDKVHRVRTLINKTLRQYAVASCLSNIGFFHFWLLKFYYMTLIYVRDYKKKAFGV